MNEYDSDIIRNVAIGLGFLETKNYKDAHLVMLNTCNIRERATDKVYSQLGLISREKKRKIDSGGFYTVIAVLGCVAQAEGQNLQKKTTLVDIVLGPQSYQNLRSLIETAFHNRSSVLSLEFDTEEKFDFLREEVQARVSNNKKPSAFITIQEGCDRFCTYCVVPYTRGPEMSRTVEDLIDEAKRLCENGVKEIVLLGQNVNAYEGLDKKGRKWSIAGLISSLAEIDQLHRIRYTTSHPSSMSKELIAVHGAETKLSSVLNLPVQSGSNTILKKMNRKYTVEQYIDIIESLRRSRSDIVISSDFIVGFPGETNDDFEQTMKLIDTVRFSSQCFSFKYSPRPGTVAAAMEQVDESIKCDRLLILQERLEKQRRDFNIQFLGKNVSVMFDNLDTRKDTQIAGRTEFNQIAIIDDILVEDRIKLYGQILQARVIQVNENSLVCELLE